MKQLILVAIALTAAMAGCATALTDVPRSLEPATVQRALLPIDPAQATVAEVQWRVAEDTGVTDAERRALASRLQAELHQALSSLPTAPQGRAVVLRAAITRVEPVSPALNTVSALLLFVPLDRGGATVEIEAIDARTGQQVATLSSAYFPPLSEFKARFSRLAPAEIALAKAAADFARLLADG